MYQTVYSKSASRVIDCETVLFMVTDRVLKEFYRHTGVIFFVEILEFNNLLGNRTYYDPSLALEC